MLSGFGVERLGLAVLRRPLVALALIACLSLLALFGLTRLGFSGANVDILRDGSQELADYDHLLATFRNFNNDAVVLVRADNLATVAGIERYRDLHFEFQFEDTVESVLSLFSLVQYNPAAGGWRSALPAQFNSDEEVAAALERIGKEIPNSRSLLNAESGSAVIVVYVKPSAVKDANVRATVKQLQAVAQRFTGNGMTVTVAGQPAIRSSLIDNIATDLMRLLPIALAFCAAIAWFVLGTWPPVLITTAAPLAAVSWLLGGMGLAGSDINFLTNILPVLLVVVVFSDCLHLYLRWEEGALAGSDVGVALAAAIRSVGPACVISSATTAAALFSLVLSSNNGLIELGVIGGLGVLGGLVSVLAVLPLAILAAWRLGFRPAPHGVARLRSMVGPALAAMRRPWVTVAIGGVFLAAGLVAHVSIDSRFRLVDYLANGSDVASGEQFIDKHYPGSTPLFVMVDIDRDKSLLDPASRARFDAAIDSIKSVFPSTSFYSLGDFSAEMERRGVTLSEKDIDRLPRYLTSRFISEDHREILVTIFSSANLSAKEMAGLLGRLETHLAGSPAGGHAVVTGYPVLAAIVAPRLMDNLRWSLLSSIALSILLIAAATRSARIGLACLAPNLLPIVCVELALWLAGIPLNLSVAVALTVAFGLAVNDSIHLSADYLDKLRYAEPVAAMSAAIRHVFPAMAATTIILLGGLAVMLGSTLPAIVLFSMVMILTLFFALIFDVFQLPAYALLLTRRARGIEPKEAAANAMTEGNSL